jgi:hypothetical protein
MPGLRSSIVLLLQVSALFAGSSPVSDRVEKSTRRVRAPITTPVLVRATVGEVDVTGWNRPEIQIEVECTPGVSAAVHQTDTALTVTAVQPEGGRSASVRGSIAIRVPFDQVIGSIELFEGRIVLKDLRAGVRARVEHGSIDADGLSGSVRLETVIGDVRLERAGPDGLGPIRLRTFNGNVALGLAAPATNARILVLSLAGAIQSDIPLHLKTAFGPRFGEATLGRGEPVVSIDVVNGDIRISSPRS